MSGTDLGTLGGPSSFAADLNDAGTVIGWSDTAGGVTRAFRWTGGGGMMSLGTLPGDHWSRAVRISRHGWILGVSGSGPTNAGTPVLWSPSGRVQALPIQLLPSAMFGQPSDFNERGVVVGWDVIALQHAWAWNRRTGKYDITAHTPGGFEGVASAVNVRGRVVGTNHAGGCPESPECWHAFVWSRDGGSVDLGIPGTDPNTNVSGTGENDQGSVVGWVSDGGATLQPYRWARGVGFTRLPAPGYAYAVGINGHDDVVGAGVDSGASAIGPMFWPARGGRVSLARGDPSPGVALAINERGGVVGWLVVGSAIHAMLWVPGVSSSSTSMRRMTSTPAAATPASVACLTMVDALISRAALLACVAGS
jgi:probable HAF family extracellular repeat protein